MTDSRITFFGNPWPEGHPIKKFEWLAREKNGQIWFDLHLVTKDYDSERSIEDHKTVKPLSDWEAPIAWKNFHACTLSSNFWHEGGFAIGNSGEITLESLDELEVSIDSTPSNDTEDNAFHVYLLGHDATAHHRIKFLRVPGTDRFNIHWVGKLALAYVGDYEYKYAFEANIFNVSPPKLPGV